MSTKSLNESDPNDLGGHEKNLSLKVLDAAEVEDIAIQDGVSAIYEAKCRLSTSLLSLFRLVSFPVSVSIPESYWFADIGFKHMFVSVWGVI